MAKIRLSKQAEDSYKKLHAQNREIFSCIDRALENIKRDAGIGIALTGPLEGRHSLLVGANRIIYEKKEMRY